MSFYIVKKNFKTNLLKKNKKIKNNLLKEAKKNGIEENNQAIYNFMLDRVKANLHVIVCMSPVGIPFRNRIRMYPALVNCTTIDMFHQWQQEALLEVGERYLSNVVLEGNEQVPLYPNATFLRSIIIFRSPFQQRHQMNFRLPNFT